MPSYSLQEAQLSARTDKLVRTIPSPLTPALDETVTTMLSWLVVSTVGKAGVKVPPENVPTVTWLATVEFPIRAIPPTLIDAPATGATVPPTEANRIALLVVLIVGVMAAGGSKILVPPAPPILHRIVTAADVATLTI